MKKRVSTSVKALVLAIGASLLAASPANAAIVYFNPLDATSSYLNQNIINFDPLNSGVNLLQATVGDGYQLVFMANISGPNGYQIYHNPSWDAMFLGSGSSIGSGGTFASGSFYSSNPGPWDGQTTGYVGWRFEAGGGNWNYGWAHFTYDQPNGAITLIDYAFNTTPNQQILAGDTGAVPEPTTIAMAFIGITGLVAARIRHNKKAAAA